MSTSGGPVLSINDLAVEFDTPDGIVRAVDRVSYQVHPGEVVGVVGESGCGKTVTALAILGLVAQPGYIAGGEILFEGRDLLTLPATSLREIRGARISMVFQDPQTSLNPVLTIGRQIVGVLRAHQSRLSTRAARVRALELLQMVGISDARHRIDDYPHQWSGGMCQRAMIAMAVANQPRVLIADEPTTALDVTVQAQVLDVLRKAQQETDAACLLITHDLGVVAEMADRVVVMYAGRVVETASTSRVFHHPQHPYTAALMESMPRVDTDDQTLAPIPGQPPELLRLPAGCVFRSRCKIGHNRHRCASSDPQLRPVGASGQLTACHFPDEVVPPVAVGDRTGVHAGET